VLKKAPRKSASSKKGQKRGSNLHLFQRLLALEYVIEVLLSVELANLTEEHAKRIEAAFMRMDHPMGEILKAANLKPAHKLVVLIVDRASERARQLRARMDIPSGTIKQ
jgi:hypothetical protein